jgi:hypothetical protein
MVRTIAACALVGLSLVAARPALAFSLISLEPRERAAMLSTCRQLPGNDQRLCRRVVDDSNVIANYKRSCLEAMTLLLSGTAWARVKSLPPTLSCRHGLAQAGYPVREILGRLAGLP